jgi:valine--pyruvate aminotransferase
MVQRWVESGDIIRLSEQHIRPYYQAKAEQAVQWLQEAIPAPRLRIHKPEGALFLWLWFEGLSFTARSSTSG